MSLGDGKSRPAPAPSVTQSVSGAPKVPRREALRRVALAAGVLGAAGAASKLLLDQGGFGVAKSKAKPETRDFRVDDEGQTQFAIARTAEGVAADAASLVQRAVEAMGGMSRFVSRGDIVVVKPNIGWDRTPIHAANTNP